MGGAGRILSSWEYRRARDASVVGNVYLLYCLVGKLQTLRTSNILRCKTGLIQVCQPCAQRCATVDSRRSSNLSTDASRGVKKMYLKHKGYSTSCWLMIDSSKLDATRSSLEAASASTIDRTRSQLSVHAVYRGLQRAYIHV